MTDEIRVHTRPALASYPVKTLPVKCSNYFWGGAGPSGNKFCTRGLEGSALGREIDVVKRLLRAGDYRVTA